jgi:hypothetical protein
MLIKSELRRGGSVGSFIDSRGEISAGFRQFLALEFSSNIFGIKVSIRICFFSAESV